MKKFHKNQLYRFDLKDIIEDHTIPTDKSIIKIKSARGLDVYYEMVEGEPPTNSSLRFWKDSEMAENLTLI